MEPGEQGELLHRSTAVVTALASDTRFRGFQATSVGPRNTTLALWPSPAAAEAAIARAAPQHGPARQRVERGGFARRGYTSFWQPYRVNDQFARCACGVLQPLPPGAGGTCRCGAVPEPAPYV